MDAGLALLFFVPHGLHPISQPVDVLTRPKLRYRSAEDWVQRASSLIIFVVLSLHG